MESTWDGIAAISPELPALSGRGDVTRTECPACARVVPTSGGAFHIHATPQRIRCVNSNVQVAEAQRIKLVAEQAENRRRLAEEKAAHRRTYGRGVCFKCGRTVALRIDNNMREHKNEKGRRCTASGSQPKEVIRKSPRGARSSVRTVGGGLPE